MKWIKFSERWPEKDWEKILIFDTKERRIVPAIFLDEGFLHKGTFCVGLSETYSSYSNPLYSEIRDEDYWMPLPNKPEVKHEVD